MYRAARLFTEANHLLNLITSLHQNFISFISGDI